MVERQGVGDALSALHRFQGDVDAELGESAFGVLDSGS